VAVGLLHGAAGSASLLALVPLTGATSPWSGLGYLLTFGAGVLAAMLVFGGLLGSGLGALQTRRPRVALAVRVVLALAAMTLGVVWLRGGA
jgi:sulfite exporter TauE/SafE